MRIAILGSGTWGTALGKVLQENGNDVILWHYKKDFVKNINSKHIHPYLPGIQLNPKLRFTSSLNDLFEHGEMLVSAIPSQAIRGVLGQFPKKWNNPVISTSKGIELNSGMRVSGVISEVLELSYDKIIVLSGPSHAEELIRKFPTTIVAASSNKKYAQNVQSLLSNEYFRIYTSEDTIGVEFGAAAKNIIALAAGICHGLGLGDNTMAALITRGLEEITRLGITMGAQRSTFSGLSGMGDLVVTAFSQHSRNRMVGERIGKGEELVDILSSIDMIAEGVDTTRSIYDLSIKHKIEMPICTQIYQVLFNNKDPRQAILNLMSRELVEEHYV
mgnify:CR=1 FL=1|tara:strand:+ start:1196 stop:2188 length:993 start_codon:yes stop_codon:yes gene_type:complete